MAIKGVMIDINQKMSETLRNAKDKLGGSLSLFLIDSEDGNILSQFPQEESKDLEYIGLVCGANFQGFEIKAKQMKKELYIQEMEIKTESDIQVFLYRVTSSFILCIVAEKGFSSGYARRLCEGSLKDEISQNLERMGFSA